MQLRHGEQVGVGAALVLVFQLAVDGDDVLQQQDRHHQQLIAQTYRNGAKHHQQDAVAAQPVTAGPSLRSHEQHEEAAQNDVGRHEDVQSLQDLLHDQELKVHSVVEELAEAAQLLPLSLRYDHHKSYHRSGDSEDRGDDAESTQVDVQIVHSYHPFVSYDFLCCPSSKAVEVREYRITKGEACQHPTKVDRGRTDIHLTNGPKMGILCTSQVNIFHLGGVIPLRSLRSEAVSSNRRSGARTALKE